MDKIIGHIYESYDYDKFSFMDANRPVTKRRLRKISESVDAVGLLPIPIETNEQFKIVDGQGRFEYCKQEHLPVYYSVIEGIGMKECAAINNSQTGWGKKDYIHLYASEGNPDYELLEELIGKYNIPIDIVISACTDSQGKNDSMRVNSGEFKIRKNFYSEIMKTLDFISSIPNINRIKGRKNSVYYALIFIQRHTPADLDRVRAIFPDVVASEYSIGDTYTALGLIQEHYNKRIHDKIYFKLEYEKYQENKTASYKNRWGNRHE